MNTTTELAAPMTTHICTNCGHAEPPKPLPKTHVVFQLSMPNRGSWNGRWSGEGNLYAVTRKFPNTQKGAARIQTLTAKGSYYYRWDDGWGASVSVRAVDSKEARSINKRSKGFCGYEWMVEAILQHGAIYADHQKPEPAIP